MVTVETDTVKERLRHEKTTDGKVFLKVLFSAFQPGNEISELFLSVGDPALRDGS